MPTTFELGYCDGFKSARRVLRTVGVSPILKPPRLLDDYAKGFVWGFNNEMRLARLNPIDTRSV